MLDIPGQWLCHETVDIGVTGVVGGHKLVNVFQSVVTCNLVNIDHRTKGMKKVYSSKRSLRSSC